MPEKKDYVILSKGVHKKNFATCKSLCNLQELYTANPIYIGFSKLCALRPKWCVLAGSKVTYSVHVCSAHQYVMLLVDTMDGNLT